MLAENEVLEGVLGGEDGEAGEGEGAKAGAQGGLDPIAAALAVQATRAGAPLGPQLSSYLETQARLSGRQAALADIQVEEATEQRAIRLSGLKVRHAIDRLKLALQIFAAVAAALAGLGVLVMLYDAFTSRTVVVDAFDAPPALAARGVSGKVVATQVLDDLQKLQSATRSLAKALGTRSAWAGDIRIEVPETGVSIGEVNRLLHERLGHDLHIEGDLVQADTGGLELTVRGDGVPAKTFAGATGDLDKLSVQAAEYIYGRSQPARSAAYLEDAGRDKDALEFLPAAFARAVDDQERTRLANTWGNAYNDLFQPGPAAEKYRLAMSFAPPRSPRWWTGWANLVGAVAGARGEEAGWREAQAFLRARAAAPENQRAELRLLSNAAADVWDLPLLLQSNLADLATHGGATTIIDGPTIADEYALMHDPAKAARYIASSAPDDPTTKAEALLLQGYAALDRGDAAGAVAPLEGYYKLWLATPAMQSGDQSCVLGLAYGLAGRLAQAQAVFRRMPTPWSRCYAFEGQVLAHAGNVAGATRVWAEGVRLMPDLPAVYLARGQWEADHGDLRAAEADLSTASAKAPHFADPWKAWGDLLVREGRWTEAAAKYDTALASAPAWAELHRARDEAVRRRGLAKGA